MLLLDGLLQAIHDMFGNADEPDEERLECMVKLLQTCGKKLDQTGSPDTVKVSQSYIAPSQINSKQEGRTIHQVVSCLRIQRSEAG